MEVFQQFRAPLIILSALPWVLLFAWIARRLLGARYLSLGATLLSGVIGYTAGLALASAIAGAPDEPGDVAFIMAGTTFTIVFIMVSIVGLELFSQRRPVERAPRIPSMPHPIRAVRLRVQATRRLTEVARIAMRHGLGGVLGLDRRAGTGKDIPAGAARRARQMLEEAGGMFVKLGQLLSTRVDLVSPAAAEELKRLQERAAPADRSGIRNVVEEELGVPVQEVFTEFDWKPLAAASLGQVHAARLRTGERVAVKVQRPGIADIVDRDLAIVRRLARTVEYRTEWGQAFGVRAIAEEFAARLRDELDYRLEAASAGEVRTALEGVPEIYVHKVWDELSTTRLLVMEHVEGTSVGKLDGASQITEEERSRLADALVRAELEPMLTGGRFHADPHPGNVFLLSDGRLGLLDFGATGRLDAFEQASVTAMLAALREGDPALLREAVFEVADVRSDIDPTALDRALAQFMARHLGSGQAPDAAALSELLRVFGAHGIKLPPTTTTMFRALVTLEGTLSTLVPGYRVVEAAERLGYELMSEALSARSMTETARDELLKLVPLLKRVPRHLDRIATIIERGELRTHLNLFSDRQDVEVVTRLVNRTVLALIGSAVGIASAILLVVDAGPPLTPALTLLDVLGYIGLAGGAVLVLRVVLAALRDEQ